MVDPSKDSVDKWQYRDNVELLSVRATKTRKWCEDIGGSFDTVVNEDDKVVGKCTKNGNYLRFEGEVYEDSDSYSGVGNSVELEINGERFEGGRVSRQGNGLEFKEGVVDENFNF